MDPTLAPSPVKVAAVLVPRPWGARRLPGLVGAAQREEAIGEAWLAGPDSVVVDGPHAGATLESLCARGGERFVGRRPFERHGARMPLLVKLLDAAEPLSVQVHPDDGGAARLAPNRRDLGKTEAWLVLEAEPGSVVWWGFEREVDERTVRAAAAGAGVTPLLRRLEVGPGDVVVNEAGTVHAMGGGLLVYELQQASDLTFRLDDHGRRSADGRPRELHLDEALLVARLGPADGAGPPVSLGVDRVLLARTSAFTMERWRVGGEARDQSFRVDGDSLEVWTVLEGEAVLHAEDGTVPLGRYGTVVLPAGLGPARWSGSAALVRGCA